MRDGELYMPVNSVENRANLLTGTHTDSPTHTPAYKETAVQMRVVTAKGESPLPRTNFRFGHRTPQAGVEVQRKWRQPGYKFPADALVQIDTTKGA